MVGGNRIKMIDIRKYTDFFHDGTLSKIFQNERNIILWIKSAQIDEEEDLKEYIPLSEDHRIKGELHIENILDLKILGENVLNIIEKPLAFASILDFEIENNHLFLSVLWNYLNPRRHEYLEYNIEAEKIWWKTGLVA